MVVLVVIAYHLTFINRFFPLQEGWFQLYSDLMAQGEVMYRDFYLFIPPLFPLEMHLVNQLAGGQFLAFRVYGLVQRLVLAGLIYFVLIRFFKVKYAWMATAVGAIVYASNRQDIVYGYYQSSLLVATAAIFLMLKFVDRFREGRQSARWWLIASGAMLGVAFLYKQSAGALLVAASLVVLSVIMKRRGVWFVVFALLEFLVAFATPLVACGIWLASQGALGPAVSEIFGGASSKGALLDILFAFWGRQYDPELVWFFALATVALAALWWWRNGPLPRRGGEWLKAGVAGALGLAAIVAGWVKWGERLATTTETMMGHAYVRFYFAAVAGVMVLGLLAGSLAATRSTPSAKFVQRHSDVIAILAIAVLELMAVGAVWFISPESRHVLYSDMGFFNVKADLVMIVFYASVLLAGAQLLGHLLGFRRLMPDGLWAVLVGAVAWMYAHGMSYAVEAHAMSLALPIIVCILLTIMVPGRRLLQYLVSFLLVVLTTFSVTQKMDDPYWWWGWREPAIVQENSAAIAVNRLQGFRVSARTARTVEGITGLIEDNTDPHSTVYTFPHLALFNTLTGRTSTGTFAPVSYWDVCPDQVAQDDARRLHDAPPDIIVWANISELHWKFHEDAFRGGQRSGQREIRNVVEELVSTRYSKLGTFENIDVWKRQW
ncbi:glycosyltransferase family 39 protein [Propionicimonas sp.]|uniref:glycosyltransferase family 39 protein n=1 Tax=Propionicimonas sp. TaxID=1955623 RepID=UPI00181F1A9A|nr:glycosyltransferase family 39 protein [Propionicimonas sp.]MBU3975697.1 glycosyltransferase family 39 protein [Actinomycetota bacterium]MBA3019900.1 glycosyltransferase family 39 protein [Propionicimonas sp.]MBU3986154.1 glycosyltransferase family 39 protein [Actinomycetota bacterium]MBU4007723.1 glycosyltransferase family 39 protein [Actinomycetota bacterium]MBU4063981.1 glycosyltransferase family 39 protein [Actinomycetota bacterium]